MALTEAGDVTLVPVPGHSPGQLAVVVEDGDHTVFLAGDSSYTRDALVRGVVDGVGPDEAAERFTHERVRAYAAETPTVYLPSHDPETGAHFGRHRTVGLRGKRRSHDHLRNQRTRRGADRGGLRLRLGPAPLPRWNSAVQTVRGTSGERGGPLDLTFGDRLPGDRGAAGRHRTSGSRQGTLVDTRAGRDRWVASRPRSPRTGRRGRRPWSAVVTEPGREAAGSPVGARRGERAPHRDLPRSQSGAPLRLGCPGVFGWARGEMPRRPRCSRPREGRSRVAVQFSSPGAAARDDLENPAGRGHGGAPSAAVTLRHVPDLRRRHAG
jgi:hypothetical protein